MKTILLACAALLLYALPVTAQVYSNKVVGERHKEFKDSLANAEYPYIFPFYGEEVTKRGFDLPYSAGLGVNYLWQESDLLIQNLNVGFNNGPMHDLSEIVRMNGAVASLSGVNLRPDLWVLPFLNVYAIFGVAKTSTTIDASLWLPDETGEWSEIEAFSSEANFDAQSTGFGITPTIGVGGGWMAFDMNFVWTDISALEKPAYSFVFGPRIGKSFNLGTPERTVSVWVGAFRLHIASTTSGSLDLSEVLPTEGLQDKVDNGLIRVGEAQEQVNDWWGGLSTQEQQNPVNVARYETANRAIAGASNVLTSLDGALNDSHSSTVQYSLDKMPKDKWNFLVGAQFQLNKHLMIRGEYGFLGSRQQFIGGLQYRFGL